MNPSCCGYADMPNYKLPSCKKTVNSASFENILMDFIIYLGIFGEGMCEYFQ